jgi:tetratricopeptide (TPR) repeat protein
MHNALDDALFAYEQALRHNLYSTQTLNAISTILRTKEQYQEAMDYLRNIIKMEPANGEAWGNLGHCHLMMDNLQDAYTAYQQALYYLPDPKVHLHRPLSRSLLMLLAGTETVVRYWYPVRSLWFSRARRGSLFPSYAHGAWFRKGE